MAKRRARIRLLAMPVAALVVGPVGAEALVVSAARMLDAKPLKTWEFWRAAAPSLSKL